MPKIRSKTRTGVANLRLHSYLEWECENCGGKNRIVWKGSNGALRAVIGKTVTCGFCKMVYQVASIKANR